MIDSLSYLLAPSGSQNENSRLEGLIFVGSIFEYSFYDLVRIRVRPFHNIRIASAVSS